MASTYICTAITIHKPYQPSSAGRRRSIPIIPAAWASRGRSVVSGSDHTASSASGRLIR
ncbi:hypothetical protein KIPE111705_05650 [Kibdelosporangium persicum]|nr:hypothetical protein [Kibdelosporangium persicum]